VETRFEAIKKFCPNCSSGGNKAIIIINVLRKTF